MTTKGYTVLGWVVWQIASTRGDAASWRRRR